MEENMFGREGKGGERSEGVTNKGRRTEGKHKRNTELCFVKGGVTGRDIKK